MNVLILPCHSILEYDEYLLFKSMGHSVFSLGSYINPRYPHDPKRPAIDDEPIERFLRLAETHTKDNLHEEWIEWADVIVVHHVGRWIIQNWHKMRHKRVIWRTIGQSLAHTEEELAPLRADGLQIVRYSPKEKNIPGYIGEDAMIRFYVDEDEYKGWTGKNERVMTMIQDVPHRRDFVKYDYFERATRDIDRVLFGPDNETVTDVTLGGVPDHSMLKKELRTNRVFFYTGTAPASYTLGFMEALATGIPIVGIGPKIANNIFDLDLYEVGELITNGVDGYIFDDEGELAFYTKELINDYELAKRIGAAGRQRAIELFGKQTIKSQWEQFLS